jgi:hypothetical protein
MESITTAGPMRALGLTIFVVGSLGAACTPSGSNCEGPQPHFRQPFGRGTTSLDKAGRELSFRPILPSSLPPPSQIQVQPPFVALVYSQTMPMGPFYVTEAISDHST